MSKKSFICDHCGLEFHRKDNIKRHILTRHFNPDSRLSRITCPYCKLQFIYFKQLDNHVTKVHHITIEEKDFIFNTEKEFYKWKEDEEIKSMSQFFVQQNHRNKKGERTIQYHCTRSGTYKPKINERKRSARVKGSRKIGTVCLARINAIFTGKEVCVKYYPVHGPHEKQFCHLSLPKSQEQLLACKIEKGSNLNDILDEVRNEVMSTPNMQKKHFISKKKLYNIKKKYKIISKKVESTDQKDLNIATLLKECKKMAHDPFLLYKKENEKHEVLKNSDIFIVIMTENQREMLRRFSDDLICIDSVYDAKFPYRLIIIEVVDEFEEAFPCSFCVTNRVDTVTMSLFFEIVRNQVGRKIESSIFMSDDDQCYYEAWRKVMGEVHNKVLCRWHVNQNLMSQLNNVSSKKEKCEMISCAKRLLEEVDIKKFSTLMEIFLEKLKNFECYNFHDYFVAKYACNPESWAACYRHNTFINTNVILETFHKIVKQVYIQSNKSSSLDTFFYNLLKIVRNKILDRMIGSEEGHIAHYTEIINKRHRLSSEINNVKKINDYEWHVHSVKSNVIHIIKFKKALGSCTCRMKCDVCGTCVHEFSCSCHDYLISNNLCKHIHAVNMSIISKTEILVVQETNDICVDDNFFIENVQVEDFICETVSSAEPESAENLLHKFEQIYTYIGESRLNNIPEDGRFQILRHAEGILNVLKKYDTQ